MKDKEDSFYEMRSVTFFVVTILAAGFIVIFGVCISLFFFGFQPQSIPFVSGYLEAKSVKFHVGCSGSTEDVGACISKALDVCGRQKNGEQTLYIKQISVHGENEPIDVFFRCEADSHDSITGAEQHS
ncbi:hypothetical protein [Paraburkholderia sp. J41]|uniref:hypothetical protein n=1 Tax=Paraburkholderia sp. J41 TaxID=2805433 RepID=UPI002AC339BE|nr:hypothetical protein [Paraburkholderia sp. J41]